MKRSVSILLSIVIVFSVKVNAFANDTLNSAAQYVLSTVTEPALGSVGGEWAIIGLKRSGFSVDDAYYNNYLLRTEECIKKHSGVLHERKYTEYSRVVLALTALGADVTDFGGYNLLIPLANFEKTVWQGTNGAVWALIALDSANYEIPDGGSATRQLYIEKILSAQNSDGGFSLTQAQEISDVDITAMAIMALANYQGDEAVKTAIDNALLYISDVQTDDGGFASIGSTNSESVVQVICALCALKIPLNDARFVKNGKTVYDNLLSYRLENGGFEHVHGGGVNLMATEQALYALAAIKRFENGENSLFNMSDVSVKGDFKINGLSGKHSDIKIKSVVYTEKSFSDISGHINQKAIEELAKRKIINGKSEYSFEPNSTMTRAEFATIIVSALGLELKSGNTFYDISEDDWFCPYAETAYEYGIVNGVGNNNYAPYDTITKQEAAVMVARAAKLCGMNTEVSSVSARDSLSAFYDYRQCAEWANSALAFCYSNEILNSMDIEIMPLSQVKRGGIAQMIYNLLQKSYLISE